MRSALNSRVQLELLRKLRNQKPLIQKGFTLVELMIVVAIVGILSAVALPQFLGARTAARAGAAVGEAVGLAKECATFVASGVGAAPTIGATTNIASGSCTSAGATITTTDWGTATQFSCVGQTLNSTKAVVSVSSAGVISCAAG